MDENFDEVSEYSLDPNEIELQPLDQSELDAINKQNLLIQKSKSHSLKKNQKSGITSLLKEDDPYKDGDNEKKIETE